MSVFTEDSMGRLMGECLVFAQSKIKPPNPAEFIAQLPTTYIVLLMLAKKILKSGVEYATFESIYDNYKQYHKRTLVNSIMLERSQILKVFLDLIRLGMLVSDQTLDSDLLHKSRVKLRVSLEAFDDYLSKNNSRIPEQIKEWSEAPIL